MLSRRVILTLKRASVGQQLVNSLGSFQNDVDVKYRQYHVTTRQDSALVIGGIAVFASAVVAQRVLKAIEASKSDKSNVHDTTDENPGEPTTNSQPKSENVKTGTKEAESPGVFSNFGASWFAKNFYDGGFEDKMTKREAALILGVRESATVERIKDAHKRILIINHPDRGGSDLIASKVNEAKELLLKGK